MVLEEPRQVTQPVLLDVTSVRDQGMQALILLAVSLGWNVMQKHNQPVVITSRDGTQKRLPTNTSIRMSVFQTALSTIMAHTQEFEPTIELIEAIIALTKPSKDHERRLRLAVGETPAQHRERLANERAAEKREEHLTQRIEMTPEVAAALDEAAYPEWAATIEEAVGLDELEWAEPDPEPPAEEPKRPEPPADGKRHGKLVSHGPFMAHHHSNAKGHKAMQYQSDTSYERVWEDGFKDYECMVCGAVYATPKGVGSHRQIHTKRGELPKPTEAAWKRSPRRFVDPNYVAKKRGRPKKEEPEPEPEVELVARATNFEDAEEVLGAIIELVTPNVVARYEAVIGELQQKLAEAENRVQVVEGEFDALVDLLNSRRRTDG